MHSRETCCCTIQTKTSNDIAKNANSIMEHDTDMEVNVMNFLGMIIVGFLGLAITFRGVHFVRHIIFALFRALEDAISNRIGK